MKDPYNNPSKDKVTLSFANCYDKPKSDLAGIWVVVSPIGAENPDFTIGCGAV